MTVSANINARTLLRVRITTGYYRGFAWVKCREQPNLGMAHAFLRAVSPFLAT